MSKPVTLLDFVKARAIGQLVNYFHHCGGRESDWEQVTMYAFKEWRNTDPEILLRLVRMAKAAKAAADCQTDCKGDECIDQSLIPGFPGE